MSICWRFEMSIDRGIIDDDHKFLIRSVNRFSEMVAQPHLLCELPALLSGLQRYSQIHFDREEELQRCIHYPFHEAHRREHQDMVEQLTQIAAGFERNHLTDPRQAVSAVGALLRAWLIDHILKSDMLMRPYVREMASFGSQLAPLIGMAGHERLEVLF